MSYTEGHSKSNVRLGLFGGTFDPIHNAHLTVAREAADQFDLEQVWFVPAAHPPHKAGQSCANYPLGPHSDQNIGNDPVWWTTFVGACTPHRFQVISGVILRSGLTAWLHSPSAVTRMPANPLPRAFGVAGGLIHALIATNPATVTLRNAHNDVVYTAPVQPLTGVPTVAC